MLSSVAYADGEGSRYGASYHGVLNVPQVVAAAPPTLFLFTNAQGEATRLGHYTSVYPHVVDLTTGQFSGLQTITVADGDQLYILLTGRAIPTAPEEYRLVMRGTVIGGTGQLANARGSIEGTGTASFITLIVEASFTGRISTQEHEE
jgi:hypothetical protein